MFYKLSISNIKRSFKDYTIYFVTLILGVCIFYIFNSIDSQTAMLEVVSSRSETIKNVEEILSYVSVFVSIILGFLIIYASRFLIKKRKKEFGIYMTLGMSKRKISFVLLLETFFIGLISLVIGLLVGIGVSQVTSVFVANMFEANMSKYTFNFSKAAMLKTILYFGIIYIVVMIFNTIVINKQKLIDLIQDSKKQEKIKIKNSFICFVMFMVSISMLVFSYYCLVKKQSEIAISYKKMVVLFLMLSIATLIFFYSLAGILLKIVSKCHGFYCNKLNTFVSKQLSSKINTMVIAMSIICIALTITLSLLPCALTLKNNINKDIKKYTPVDFQVIHNSDEKDGKERVSINEIIESNTSFKDNIKDMTIINRYYDENLNYDMLLGEYKNELNQIDRFILDDSPHIVGESEYNKMAVLCNFDTVKLEDNEYAIVTNAEIENFKKVVNKNTTIHVFGKDLKPYKKVIDGFYDLQGGPYETGYVVVKDNILKKKSESAQMLIGNYSTKDEKIIENIEKTLQEKVEALEIKFEYNEQFQVNTKAKIKEAQINEALILIFISIYLGSAFLISSAAILALKELSDCLDDKDKFKILRQIGADEKDINKALFKQTFIFFVLPLALASIHAIFILKYSKFVLSISGINDVFKGSLVTFAFLIAIYGIYFIVTYLCGKGIIKGKKA